MLNSLSSFVAPNRYSFLQCCPSAVSPSAPGAGFVNVAGGSQGQVGGMSTFSHWVGWDANIQSFLCS